MSNIKLFAALLLLIAFVSACKARETATTTQVATKQGVVISEPVKGEAWERQWDTVVKEAKKEAVVTIYGIPVEVREQFTRKLKEKFGLDLDTVYARGPEMAAKILAERKAGIFNADLYIGGPSTPVVQLKPEGALDPIEPQLILPEVKDTKAWFGGGLRFLDKDRLVLAATTYVQAPIAYNHDMVRKEEVKSYRDLLNPKNKGKISINDPTVAVPGWAWFGTMAEGIPGGLDFLRQVVKLEPVIVRDHRIQIEWLAQGKYPIAIAPFPPTLTDFIKISAHISLNVPEEGAAITSGAGNIALINKAAHPKAARLFLNYFLSREGQMLYSQTSGFASGRLDIPTAGLDVWTLPEPDKKYFQADSEEFILRTREHFALAREVFMPFLK